MTALRKSVEQYLAMRRRLGFKLQEAGLRLNDFVSFMEDRRARRITSALALNWAQRSHDVQPVIWRQRLGVVRDFARYLSAFEPRTEVPPDGLLPHRYRRRAPYLYTDQEVQRILAATLKLYPPSGLGRWTYHMLIGLLSVTGMRPGEALNLELQDVDLKQCVLTVRGSKFGKSRWVVIHPSTRDALSRYLRRRGHCFAERADKHVFLTTQGTALREGSAVHTFRRLTHKIGLCGSHTKRNPRLTDFRHCFAVKSLVRFYRSDKDPQRWLSVLSTHLGHAWTKETYWYIEQHPALMHEAMKRLERRWKDTQ
jgi:integrase/recombinase XerD